MENFRPTSPDTTVDIETHDPQIMIPHRLFPFVPNKSLPHQAISNQTLYQEIKTRPLFLSVHTGQEFT
eukprot:2245136-Amphidinium_carterae.1